MIVNPATGEPRGTPVEFFSPILCGSTTATSEKFFATVEADAKRTAKEAAKHVAEYYRRHGWLAPQCCSKLMALNGARKTAELPILTVVRIAPFCYS